MGQKPEGLTIRVGAGGKGESSECKNYSTHIEVICLLSQLGEYTKVEGQKVQMK